LGRDFGDLPVGHVGQAREHVPKISKGVKAAASATFDEGVNDGTALTGLGIADEEPVFFYAELGIEKRIFCSSGIPKPASAAR
jgi:hypothetical protein